MSAVLFLPKVWKLNLGFLTRAWLTWLARLLRSHVSGSSEEALRPLKYLMKIFIFSNGYHFVIIGHISEGEMRDQEGRTISWAGRKQTEAIRSAAI